jgi:signal peptidase II
MFSCAALALWLDQWLKFWVINNMSLHYPSIPLIPGYFALTYTRNFGAAWSMLWSQTHLLIGIAGVVACGIVLYAIRERHSAWLQMIGLGFLLGGALGNLLDRSRLGYVIDMFDLQYGGRNIFPIFNIADICIDIGVACLLLYSFMAGRQEKAALAAEATLGARPGDA